MYHLNDIANYPSENSTIISGIPVIDRKFIEMGLLKLINEAIAFKGLQITRPFHALVFDPSTT